MTLAENQSLIEILISSAVPIGGLLVLFLVAAWAVSRIRGRFRDREDRTAGTHQMLIQYRELHRNGDLSDEEYRSIKSRLVQEFEPSAHKVNSTPSVETNEQQPIGE